VVVFLVIFQRLSKNIQYPLHPTARYAPCCFMHLLAALISESAPARDAVSDPVNFPPPMLTVLDTCSLESNGAAEAT